MTVMPEPRATPVFGPSALLTPANGLTFARMALTPVMMSLILQRRLDGATFGLWVGLCSTDGVDGLLARRYGVTSSGAFLDPLADKFLVLGGMGALVAKQVFAWPLVVIIGVREIGMSVYRVFEGSQGVSIPARRSAKVKTFVQQLSVGFAVMPWMASHAPRVGRFLLVIACALTVSTGWQYFAEARRARSNPGREH